MNIAQTYLFVAVAFNLFIGCGSAQQIATQAQPAPLISTGFGGAGAKMKNIQGEKVSGSLAEPWEDESAWAPLRVRYESLGAGGETFQRMVVSQLESGRAQMVHPLPLLNPNALYVLEMRMRSTPQATGVPEAPLTLAVRHRNAPYQFQWQEQVVLSRDWQDLSFTFTPSATDTPVGFYIMKGDAGTLDIARVKLSVTTREDYIKTLEAKYPGGGPRNLLSQTRFPLGVPPGWNLDAAWGDDRGDEDEPHIESDKLVIGPSGSPALHLQGPRAFILSSAAFVPVLPHRQHVASVFMRGRGTGHWSVQAGDKELARKTIALNGTDWQRQELAFTPDLTTKAHTLRFQSESGFDLWIDGVQVAVGEAAKEYSTQMASEVALSTGSLTGIHFEDQPAQIQYAVSGNAVRGQAARAKLKFRIVNLYGEEATPAAVALKPGALQSGQINYTLFPRHPLGVYRVEAWVEDAAGKQLSPYSEVVVNRLRRPRYWMKDAPQSPFGAHLLSTTHDIEMAKAMGINWARLHDAGASYIGWDFVERDKGKWNFRDSKIQRYRKHHIKLLGGLSTTPRWARTNKEEHDGFADRWSQPADMADYANYVKTITQRYKGTIDAYEIWNEPWLSKLFWHASYDNGYKASADPQADYARLMKAGYAAAKSGDPAITIAGINTSTHSTEPGFIDGSDWTWGVLQHGGLQACDVISYHQYLGEDTAFPTDVVERGFHKAIGPISASVGNLPKPVWMTEGSSLYGVNKSQGFYRYSLPAPNTENNLGTADKLCRYVVSLLGRGVEKVFLYSMATRGSDWAVLVNYDGTMHPSGAAHSHLAWQLEDMKFARRIELAPNVFAYLFGGKGRAVAVLAPKGQAAYTLPKNNALTISDLWGNNLSGGANLGRSLTYLALQGRVETLEQMLQNKAPK
jgi:hypothetical protein